MFFARIRFIISRFIFSSFMISKYKIQYKSLKYLHTTKREVAKKPPKKIH